jgi:hypothetical protein
MFLMEMGEDLLDHQRIVAAGDYPSRLVSGPSRSR